MDTVVQARGIAVQRGQVLCVTGTQKTATYVDTGIREPMLPDQGQFSIVNGRLTGRCGNHMDGWVNISFARS